MLADRKKALVVFGTRPEVIKLSPVIKAMSASERFDVVTCCTGQHADMVSPVCNFFSIPTHYDLGLMRAGQGLSYVMATAVERLGAVFAAERPDVCIVQG